MITSVKSNFPLKDFNTFNISAKAKYFFEFSDELSLIQILKNKKYKKEKLLILGGGSNLLFSRDYDGIILKNSISGVKTISEDQNSLIVEVGAGENWHDFVLWSVEKKVDSRYKNVAQHCYLSPLSVIKWHKL